MKTSKHFLFWLLISAAIFLIFFLSKTARSQSIEIMSGVVVDSTDVRIEVGPGTYIPEPANKELAKKIIDLNTNIESFGIRLEDANEKIVLLTTNAVNIEKSYQSRVEDLEIENAMLRGWWSRVGKTLAWCAVAAGAGFVVGYEINHFMEKS